MSYEIQLLFSVTNICVVIVVLQLIWIDSWCMRPIWAPMLRACDSDTIFWQIKLVISLFHKGILLYYKSIGRNFMCPVNLGQKHPSSDKETNRILENQPKSGHCLASWNEKKPCLRPISPCSHWTAGSWTTRLCWDGDHFPHYFLWKTENLHLVTLSFPVIKPCWSASLRVAAPQLDFPPRGSAAEDPQWPTRSSAQQSRPWEGASPGAAHFRGRLLAIPNPIVCLLSPTRLRRQARRTDKWR